MIGSDYPPGDESDTRKTYAIRSTGTEAEFITVIEPYESDSVIQQARAIDANSLRVQLKNGSVQQISIANLTGDAAKLRVRLVQSGNGLPDQTEDAAP